MANDQPDHSEGQASYYRAYLIGRDGRIEQAIEIRARNDEDAIAQARDLTHTCEIELWDRSRVVIRLPLLTASADAGAPTKP